MKSNTRLIRLVIYLVVSIALIILLWNISKNDSSTKDGQYSSIKIHPSMEESLLVGDMLFVSKVSYSSKLPLTPISFPFDSGIPVDLPSDTESLTQNPHINIDIDSNNIYYLNDIKIEWNELVDSITVQQEREPKLSILLSVDKKTKAGYVAKVLEIVKEKNMKVGISTKN